jgi:DNA-directed RNA polymerase I subunit RPA49
MENKKRKLEDGTVQVNIRKIGDKDSLFVGSFSGIEAPEKVKFDVYKAKSELLIHGESDKIEYEGRLSPEEKADYCIAVYDKDTNSIDLYPSSLIPITNVVKSKKTVKGPAIKQQNVRNIIQRSTLGEAFGTKKAKKALQSLEKNRIDADKLVSMETSIVDSVKTNTENLPSMEAMQEQQSVERPIPPHNLETTDVNEVYTLESVIPKREYDVLRLAPIVKESDPKKKLELFPYKNSFYISTRLDQLSERNGDQTDRIKQLYYLSILLGLFENRRISSRMDLTKRLGNLPEIVVNSLIERFTVAKAGAVGKSKDRNFAIDPVCETRLLSYILVLVLRLDNFIVEIPPLARELSIKPVKLVELFRSVGCNVKPPSQVQAEAMGLSKYLLSSYKLAILSAPLKLPEVAKRRRQGGGRNH